MGISTLEASMEKWLARLLVVGATLSTQSRGALEAQAVVEQVTK